VFAELPNEKTLLEFVESIEFFAPTKIKVSQFREPDLGDSLTVVAFSGVSGVIRNHFRALRLCNLQQKGIAMSGQIVSEAVSVANGMPIIKGRWGFHPCDHATYLKLKRLNFLRYKHEQRRAEWIRWQRKDPQNRRIFVPQNPGDNKRNTCKINRRYKVKPEPVLCQITGSAEAAIFKSYLLARMPVAEAKDVVGLTMSPAAIETASKVLEEWYAKKN
jgi:hypothetical protein